MRTNYCGKITQELLHQQVTLCGWVNKIRHHGGVIFIDLRDRFGVVQVVVSPANQNTFHLAEKVHNEFVLQVIGKVRQRLGTVNKELVTGKFEVEAETINIINRAEPLPFELHDAVSEEMKLKYRYLDLRKKEEADRLIIRAQIAKVLREYLDHHDFIEIETPVLTKSTPEGARDYLVPSRVSRGKFYALPQSPQIFKQLLMAAGLDRYYQIVRCFRDEDLRADRQPEFTQLDIELSFTSEAEIQKLVELMITKVFDRILGIKLKTPWVKLTYQEAMEKYGSDKPDLRIPLTICDLTELVKTVPFEVFSKPANHPDGKIGALVLPKGKNLSRKQIDDYSSLVTTYGLKGLAYFKINCFEPNKVVVQSPITKFLTPEIITEIIKKTGAQTGDFIFFGAGTKKIVAQALGNLRLKLGQDFNLYQEPWFPLWVTDFPLFEWHDGRFTSCHHPFTAPKVTDPHQLIANPGVALARAYDLILNGVELGGGSIRIANAQMQIAVFNILGITNEEAYAQFGHLLEAFKYGYPEHGGIAFGFDRLVMLLTQAKSLREVIAFPKTQNAICPLTQAPSEVAKEQLKELGIETVKL